MSKLRFVGLDVHKDTIVIAVAEEGQSEAVVLGTFPHEVPKVIKRLTKLVADVRQLRVCYEAGPTGFGLSRRLNRAGIKCLVIAPSLVPQQAGARSEWLGISSKSFYCGTSECFTRVGIGLSVTRRG